MSKEEIKEYLRRVDELELKLTGEDKETLQWLLFGYNQLEERWNKLRKKIETWWIKSYFGSDYEICLMMVLDEMDELEGKENK